VTRSGPACATRFVAKSLGREPHPRPGGPRDGGTKERAHRGFAPTANVGCSPSRRIPALALLGYLTARYAETIDSARVFTPIMGAAILLGSLTATVRLREARAVEPASLGGASPA
jgi:hypothetical protein